MKQYYECYSCVAYQSATSFATDNSDGYCSSNRTCGDSYEMATSCTECPSSVVGDDAWDSWVISAEDRKRQSQRELLTRIC